MKKKLLSILLTLCMVVTLLPTVALPALAAVPTTLTVAGTSVIADTEPGTTVTYWKTSEGGITSDGANDTNYTVKYDPTAATLTLKGATVNNANGDGISTNIALTIMLEDANSVTGTGTDWSNGISASDCMLIIGGSGNLTATGGDATSGSYGISAGNFGSVTIQGNATVNASGGSSATSIGIYGGVVTIRESAAVTATGGTADSSYGVSVVSAGGSISIYGGTVTAKSGTGTTSKAFSKTPTDFPTGTVVKAAESGGSLVEVDKPNADTYKKPYVQITTPVTLCGDFLVSGGVSGTDFSYDSNAKTLTIKSATHLTVSMKSGVTQTKSDNIVVNNVQGGANLTLSGVDIDGSETSNFCALSLADGAALNLTLTEENKLKSGSLRAGLEAPGGTTLNIGGTGSLTATGGGRGAGIGGKQHGTVGTITISGGTVTANGGSSSAGIGSGSSGETPSMGGTITISGGTVTATGDGNGAGIGGGDEGAGGTITITGGTVTATGDGNGAGIGGGYKGAGGTITISGGTVTATGDGHGAGIGGGDEGAGGIITISGGTVTATSGTWGAGIGGTWGAGIGGGYYSSGTPNHGTFSTGATAGNAVIIASSIGNNGDKTGWSGVIIEGNTGEVYGSITPDADFEIPTEKTLNIKSGKTLTVKTGVTLTNNGTIRVFGTLTKQDGGTITGSGSIVYPPSVAEQSGTLTYASEGSATFTVTPSCFSPELALSDYGVKWYTDAAGTTVKTADPTGVTLNINSTALLTASIDATARAGSYYFKLIAIHNGKPADSDVVTLTIGKTAAPTPAAPELATGGKGADSITLVANTVTTYGAVQYGSSTTDDSATVTNWSANNKITGLTAGTEYYFFIKYAGNDNYNSSVSPASEAIATKDAPGDEPTVGAPTVTATTVTLPTHADWEYKPEQGDWGDTYCFTGLTAATEYTYYVRVKGTDSAMPSKATTIKIYTAAATPAVSVVAIDYTDEEIAFADTLEVFSATTGGAEITSDIAGNITSYIPAYGETRSIYVRVKAVENGAPASEWTEIALAARPATPDDLSINYADEKLTGYRDAMVYSTNGLNYFQGSLATSISFLIPASNAASDLTLWVRVAPTATAPASEATEVTISKRPAAPNAPAIDYAAETFTVADTVEYAFGSETPETYGAGTGTAAALGENLGTNLYYRTAAGENSFASATAYVEISARPGAPTGSNITAVSVNGTDPLTTKLTFTVISGSGYEYTVTAHGVAPASDAAWAELASGTAIDNIAGHASTDDVHVRIKATGSAFASEPYKLLDGLSISKNAYSGTEADAPTVSSKTDEKVVLNAVTVDGEAVEYANAATNSAPSSGWQDSTSFTGLTRYTEYFFFARVKENDNHYAGGASAGLSVTTKKTAGDAPEVGAAEVTASSVTLPHNAAWEYSTDHEAWNSTYSFTGLDAATQYAYYVRESGTDDAMPSDYQTVTVYTAAATPLMSEFTVTQPSASSATGGIAGITAAHEYSADGGQSWTDGDGTELSDIEAPATYLIRVKAVLNEAPASESLTVSIAPYSPPPVYDPPATVPVVGSGTVNVPVTVSNGRAAVSVTDGQLETILAGGPAELELDLSGTGGVTAAQLPANLLDALAENGRTGLSVSLPSGSFALDADAVMHLSAQTSGASVTFTLSPAAKTPDSYDARLLARTARASCEAEIAIGGKAVRALDGKVTVSLAGLAELEKAGVYTIDENGGLEYVTTYLNGDAISFCPPHYSPFYIVDFPFIDAPSDAWFHEDAVFAYLEGLFEGTSDAAFSPAAPMTRAMLVTVLWRMEGRPAPAGVNAFDDVAADQYYTDAVVWALEKGVVDGYGDGSFGPDDTITREQLATALWRFARYRGYDVTPAAELSGFIDEADVSDYARAALSWAYAGELIDGKGGGVLDPGGSAERCQVAALLHRFCAKA